jgi:predicted nucleic acid-binding protein
VKLVVSEPDSKEAQVAVRDFLERRFSLHTVDIALAESLNAIWKHTNVHADLDPHDARAAVRDLITIHDKLGVLVTSELAEQTITIAQSQDITIYDALYIAAARKLNGTLLTSDRKLYNTANSLANAKLLKT